MSELIENILHEVNKLEEGAYFGKVTGVQGLFIKSAVFVPGFQSATVVMLPAPTAK